jgi:hypothetical protein
MRDPKYIGIIDVPTVVSESINANSTFTIAVSANRKQVIIYVAPGNNPVEVGYHEEKFSYLITEGNSRELDTTCEIFIFSTLGSSVIITEIS